MILRSDTTVADALNTPSPGIYVTVKDVAGNLATIYSDDGVTPKANPFTSGLDGTFSYYAAEGAYTEEYRRTLGGQPTQVVAVELKVDNVIRTDLAAATGATLVGTTGPSTVQADLNARPTSATLAAIGGAALIGSTGPSTVQADIAARPTSAALAASGGAALVGFLQSGTGAVTRTAQAKMRDVVSVKDFGATGDGVTDDTAAFNLATLSTTAYSSTVWRGISVPAASYVLGGGNSTVNVRLGQHLLGDGWASKLDLSANTANTVPAITLGKKSDGTPDTAGQPVQVSNLFFLGGPGTYANIDSDSAGYKITDVWMSAPGVGIDAGGSDGLISGCIFDVGVNHMRIDGFNMLVDQCLFFEGNYQITVKTGCTDTAITGCHFEYFAYNAILLDTGATGIKNLRVNGCTFLQNAQSTTSDGAISMRATSGEIAIGNCSFRNLYSAGLRLVDSGSVATVNACTFDAVKTQSSYAQSTTMKGIVVENGAFLLVNGSYFANLPGQPIEIGGTSAITVFIVACNFLGNTGGAAEILVSNTNASSKVYIIGCRSDRTLVSNTGSATVQTMISAGPDTGWTAGAGNIGRGAFATYTTVSINAAYSQAQVQTLSDNLDAVTRRALALEIAIRKAGLIDG